MVTYPDYVAAVEAYNAALDHETEVRRFDPANIREAELATQQARKVRDDAARACR